MYITYGKLFGGTPNIFMFGLFLANGSISEWTVNRALIVHTTLLNAALKKKKKQKKNNHFRHVPKLSIGFNTGNTEEDQLGADFNPTTKIPPFCDPINALLLGMGEVHEPPNPFFFHLHDHICLSPLLILIQHTAREEISEISLAMFTLCSHDGL